MTIHYAKAGAFYDFLGDDACAILPRKATTRNGIPLVGMHPMAVGSFVREIEKAGHVAEMHNDYAGAKSAYLLGVTQ